MGHKFAHITVCWASPASAAGPLDGEGTGMSISKFPGNSDAASWGPHLENTVLSHALTTFMHIFSYLHWCICSPNVVTEFGI